MTIRNGKTTAFSTGIYFIDMVSSSIESVTTLRNRFGFYIHASQKITVKDSDVEFNIYGLHLQNSDDCILVNNLLARQTYNSPGGYGLYLYASSRNRVTDNTIDSNINWGIWFSEAKGNTIFHNNVSGNSPQVSDNNPDANRWYDADKKMLFYKGVMEDEERSRLMKLSEDDDYRGAGADVLPDADAVRAFVAAAVEGVERHAAVRAAAGDGKIFISPVEESYTIRTGEVGL